MQHTIVNLSPTTTIVSSVVLMILSALSVVLRLLARWLLKVKFAADDWWIIATLVMMLAMLSIQAWGKLLLLEGFAVAC